MNERMSSNNVCYNDLVKKIDVLEKLKLVLLDQVKKYDKEILRCKNMLKLSEEKKGVVTD